MPALKKIGAAALAAFGWTSGGATAISASYLIVAGGAGSGSYAGGGGAGGLLASTTSLNPTLSYTIVVGAGGAGTSGAVNGNNGSNSTAFSVTAIGGGYGSYGGNNANSGGSGGGGGNSSPYYSGGAGTSGQGNAGGSGAFGGGTGYTTGGGGGAGAVGSNGNGSTASGNGGNGTASSISGTSTTYAGGGGGGGASVYSVNPGSGGTGGGGAGAYSTGTTGTSGTANTGGGGGGGAGGGGLGGSGGSGIVIISYAGAQQFGGGIVTSVGGNTIHTFLTSGTLSPLASLSASYLIVAGGGGGGNANVRVGGGGGAGGLLSGSGTTIDTNSTYLVTVGAGGATDVNGTNSTFSMVSTAAVGGGKGDGAGGGQVGNGGSGGGAVYYGSPAGVGGTVGTGTSGQGNNGGQGYSSAPAFTIFGGGAGGGAGAVGGAASSSLSGSAGIGGIGVASSISGTSTYYAGGGGGGCQQNTTFTSSYTGGAGGNGGGGAGATSLNSGGVVNGGNGTANTGGGGGGAGAGGVGGGSGGTGGSGIVIISYAGSTQQMAGGSVTITGGNVIHTFTSSGYLTPLTYYSNSLRFRSSGPASLNRTPTVAGNRQKYTISTWVKRGKLGTEQFILSANIFSGTTTYDRFFFESNDTITFDQIVSNSVVGRITTTAVYRDPAAWYHLVMSVDTTQTTAANRYILFVNGQQVTALNASSYPAQNAQGSINNTVYQGIGYGNGAGSALDGYLTNFNFIDGQQLTPNSFGTFNSYGVWQPINYGGSYGTNGFYLPFNSGSQTYAGGFTYASSQVLSVADNAALELGSADFCVEGWYYPTSFANNLALYSKRTNSTATGAFIIYAGSGGGTLTFYASSNGSSYFFSGTSFGTVVLNQWNHFAVYRSGNNWYGSVNGIVTSMGSNSSAIYNNTDAWRIGGDSNGNYANGYISNTRIVTGSPVYTSANFTPSTSPLTAITGTQLLTLQNATIVDNSTNAFTITNTGSVTTATSKALSTAVFLDQSPQGNNWTPNNISGATGSTLDYMTDVPTLTSTTAANYCTLNPLQLNSVTLSNGNLTYLAGTNGSLNYPCGSTLGVTSGKFYWEITVTSLTLYLGVGIASASDMATIVLNNLPIGFTASSYNVFQSGDKCNNSTTSAYQTGGYATGNVIGVAFDATNGKIWFSKNNVFPNSGDPVAGTNAAFTSIPANTYLPALSGNNSTLSANFGQQPFVYTPPSGYVALNTYNL